MYLRELNTTDVGAGLGQFEDGLRVEVDASSRNRVVVDHDRDGRRLGDLSEVELDSSRVADEYSSEGAGEETDSSVGTSFGSLLAELYCLLRRGGRGTSDDVRLERDEQQSRTSRSIGVPPRNHSRRGLAGQP